MVDSIFISLNHRTEEFISENYKKFSADEFILYIRSISDSLGVGDLPQIYFYNESDGVAGACFSRQFQGQMEVYALAFHKKLLDGITYSIYQVDETIKHELAHMIADMRYNDNCKHDERFMAVVREVGGEESESLSFLRNSIIFYTEKLKERERPYQYILSCGKCKKVHKQTDSYHGVFQLFALSGTDSPYIHLIKMGKLGCKSPCCKTCYTLEANARDLLSGLIKDDQLLGFQEHLNNILKV